MSSAEMSTTYWKLVNLTRREYIYPPDFGYHLSMDSWNHPDTAVMRFVRKNWPSTDLAVVVSDEGGTMWLTAEMEMRGESLPDAPDYYHLAPFYNDLGGFVRIQPSYVPSSERVSTYCPKVYRPKGRVEAVRWVDTPECREVMARWFEKHGDVFVTYGPIATIPTEEHDDVRLDVGDWVVHNGDEWVAMTDDVFTSCYEEVP